MSSTVEDEGKGGRFRVKEVRIHRLPLVAIFIYSLFFILLFYLLCFKAAIWSFEKNVDLARIFE